MSNEVEKTFGNTITSTMYLWYFSISNHILFEITPEKTYKLQKQLVDVTIWIQSMDSNFMRRKYPKGSYTVLNLDLHKHYATTLTNQLTYPQGDQIHMTVAFVSQCNVYLLIYLFIYYSQPLVQLNSFARRLEAPP